MLYSLLCCEFFKVVPLLCTKSEKAIKLETLSLRSGQGSGQAGPAGHAPWRAQHESHDCRLHSDISRLLSVDRKSVKTSTKFS